MQLNKIKYKLYDFCYKHVDQNLNIILRYKSLCMSISDQIMRRIVKRQTKSITFIKYFTCDHLYLYCI